MLDCTFKEVAGCLRDAEPGLVPDEVAASVTEEEGFVVGDL